jgi:hypothetical protein
MSVAQEDWSALDDELESDAPNESWVAEQVRLITLEEGFA